MTEQLERNVYRLAKTFECILIYYSHLRTRSEYFIPQSQLFVTQTYMQNEAHFHCRRSAKFKSYDRMLIKFIPIYVQL